MGRPRKADNLHRLQGTFNQTKHGDPTRDLPPGAPVAPDWMDDEMVQLFDEYVAALIPLGTLSTADATALAQVVILTLKLRRDPLEFTAADHTQLRMSMKEVGLTPLSRNNLGAALEKPANEFGDL